MPTVKLLAAPWLALLLVFCISGSRALENGLSRKPALGYNTWNCFRVDIDEKLIRETADHMVSLGLVEAGYEYLVVDDAWSERERGPGGKLVANHAKFPSGMKALADYVHSKGLKFGMYSDAGPHTCEGYPGSRGYEELDAATFAEWGVDYLKYDNCYASPEDWVVDRYTTMRDALNKTSRPILYSMCEWGAADPWLWASQVGNSWRTTEDIEPSWYSILHNLDNSIGLARYAGPGGFQDLDMLEVGNGDLTLGEQRAHFALWAMMKSPLLIGADLRRLDPDSLAILKAKELLAVSQDPLGAPADLIWKRGTKEIYAGPLADGSRAVALLNREASNTQYPVARVTVHWEQVGLDNSTHAVVRDLFAEQDLGTFTGSYTGKVTMHDVVALRITPLGVEGSPAWRPWHSQPIFAAYPEDSKVQPPAVGEVAAVRRSGLGRRAGMPVKGAAGANLRLQAQ